MAQLTATFEAGVNGNNITTAPGEASANAWDDVQRPGASNVVYDNTQKYGTLAMKATASGGANGYTEWGTSLGAITDHFGRFYLYMTANPASSFRPCRVLSTGTAAVFFLVTNLGKIQVLDSGGGQIILTTTSVNLNAWTRVEYHITHSATVGQAEVKLFTSPDSAVAAETIQTTANKNLLASANQLHYGATGGDSDGSFWLDNIIGNAASYPGPAAAASSSTAASFNPATLAFMLKGGRQ
jgi:hypothetical protein